MAKNDSLYARRGLFISMLFYVCVFSTIAVLGAHQSGFIDERLNSLAPESQLFLEFEEDLLFFLFTGMMVVGGLFSRLNKEYQAVSFLCAVPQLPPPR